MVVQHTQQGVGRLCIKNLPQLGQQYLSIYQYQVIPHQKDHLSSLYFRQ